MLSASQSPPLSPPFPTYRRLIHLIAAASISVSPSLYICPTPHQFHQKTQQLPNSLLSICSPQSLLTTRQYILYLTVGWMETAGTALVLSFCARSFEGLQLSETEQAKSPQRTRAGREAWKRDGEKAFQWSHQSVSLIGSLKRIT